MQQYNDKLIYGKNTTKNIVCIEPKDGDAEIFYEKSGIVASEFIANRYWLLASKPLDKGQWHKLDGQLHYKFGKQYVDKDIFDQESQVYRRQGAYRVYNDKEALMIKDGYTYYKGMTPDDVSILAFDIESSNLQQNSDSRVYLIANTFRSQGKIIRKIFCYDDYPSEAAFFTDWCAWVKEINPSIIVGHNIVIYDLPYLNFCASRAGVGLTLGRDSSNLYFDEYISKLRKDGSQSYSYNKAHIYGREIIDTFFLSIKSDISRKYESYGLKQIIKQEGLEIKNRQFYNASTIKDNINDPIERKKIIDYAIMDGDDALALFDLMIGPLFYLTQSIPKPLQTMVESASGGQLNSLLVRNYLQDGYSIPLGDQGNRFEGAISDSWPGIYHNTWKVDVASLYPSIILQYDIFPKRKDPRGYIRYILEYFRSQRLENKRLAKDSGKRQYKDLSEVGKVIANSIYGFYNAPRLNFNYPEGAEQVTRRGREILNTAIKWACDKDYDDIKKAV